MQFGDGHGGRVVVCTRKLIHTKNWGRTTIARCSAAMGGAAMRCQLLVFWSSFCFWTKKRTSMSNKANGWCIHIIAYTWSGCKLRNVSQSCDILQSLVIDWTCTHPSNDALDSELFVLTLAYMVCWFLSVIFITQNNINYAKLFLVGEFIVLTFAMISRERDVFILMPILVPS